MERIHNPPYTYSQAHETRHQCQPGEFETRQVAIKFKDEEILVERLGTDGDVAKARQMYLDLDGKVDAFGVGGVDLYLCLNEREYPLRAALKLVEGVTKRPLCDGRGLKHTLERRVFDLAYPNRARSISSRDLSPLRSTAKD